MDLRCPECESDRIARVPRLIILLVAVLAIAAIGRVFDQDDMAIAAVIATILIIAFTPSHRCRECGERFNAIDEDDEEREPPPPLATDLVEEICPRCGSTEVYRVKSRRTYAIAMLGALVHMIMLPVEFFAPKKRCDSCGLRL